MKKNEAVQMVSIEQVDSLESYLLHLGIMSVSINTLVKLQEKAERIGIFDKDEEELSKTLKYQTQRLFTCINDLLTHCAGRTAIPWVELIEKILKTATNSVETGSKSVVRKKGKKK